MTGPGVCVPFIINQTPAAGGDHCHGPQRAAQSAGLRAIPSTEPGPQPLLVTYNLSSLALTPGEPTPYVCMYVSMVCGMYVCVYYCRTYYKAVRGGGRRRVEDAMRDVKHGLSCVCVCVCKASRKVFFFKFVQ